MDSFYDILLIPGLLFAVVLGIVYQKQDSNVQDLVKTANSDFVQQKISQEKRYYLLLDEIQEVEEWEKAINSFTVDFNVDIYLTGSNSHLLSSELATFLAGRYVENPIYTLTFTEFLSFRAHYFPQESLENPLTSYIRKGGFPVIHTSDYDDESAYKVVYDIYSSVILRDSIQRHKIRDVELLERVIKYAFDNIGNTFSTSVRLIKSQL